MSGELMTWIGARFRRVEPRRQARAFVLGLLAGLPRENCRAIAEQCGDACAQDHCRAVVPLAGRAALVRA
jgi:hypothetical protein